MPEQLLAATDYQKLITALKVEITRGIREAERLLEHQKVLTYWAVGRHIHQYLNSHQHERGEITRFYQRISKDLDISERTLQHCEQFYLYFPKKELKKNLSWSHYRYLLAVPDKSKRQKLLLRALRGKWSSKDLRMNILLEKKAPLVTAESKELAPVRRGKLYTYRLVRLEESKTEEARWLVDCGFSNRIEAPASDAALHNKRLYLSVKTKSGYRLKVVNSNVDELYTFKARLLRVIDADTLLVLVDEGFGIWSEQRLRLNALDAPERTTLLGRKAKQWVEARLKNLPFIVVKTYKSDKYDRYLVDVFYLPGESDAAVVACEGLWLNGEMLRAGVAKRWG